MPEDEHRSIKDIRDSRLDRDAAFVAAVRHVRKEINEKLDEIEGSLKPESEIKLKEPECPR